MAIAAVSILKSTNMNVFYFCISLLSVLAAPAQCQDIVKTAPVVDRTDFRHTYAHSLLSLALEESVDRFGPYEIQFRNVPMESGRLLLELEQGENLSVNMSAAKAKWLDKTTPVFFPLMKGLASYRLFIIMEKNQQAFLGINSLSQLRKYKFGQGRGWSTGKILKDNGFRVVFGDTYSGLFPMLKAGRFDALMRGVHEVSPELARFRPAIPGLTVAKSVAVYTYLPNYFFVSNKQPGLAKRLDFGLKQAHASGKLDRTLMLYFEEDLKLLNLKERKIFFIKNTNIDASFYDRDKPYLLKRVQSEPSF